MGKVKAASEARTLACARTARTHSSLSGTADEQQGGLQQDREGCTGSPDPSPLPGHRPAHQRHQHPKAGQRRTSGIRQGWARGSFLPSLQWRASPSCQAHQEQRVSPYGPHIHDGAMRCDSSWWARACKAHNKARARNAASISSECIARQRM